MKRVLIKMSFLLGFIILVIGGLILCLRFMFMPPKEANLIANFTEHRAAFEEIKDMLIADRNLHRVAQWGVETNQDGIFRPPNGDFPVDRYNQYLALLKEIGGIGAIRNEGEHPNPGVLIWGRGFAGDTQHIGICWLDREPPNQVASLDDYYQKRIDGEKWNVVYRHIDGNWYLWTDL